MKIAIRYFTKSKKGNTFKLANALSEELKIEALTVENNLDDKVDLLFLVNAMYALNIDKEVKKFLKENKDKIKMLVNVNSAASGSSTWKAVKKVTDKEGINLIEDNFHCVGSWLNLNKGRPSEEDLSNLKKFAAEILKKYSK